MGEGSVDEVRERQRARLRVRVGAAVVLVLVGLGCAVLVVALGGHGETAQIAPPTVEASGAPSSGAIILVHVLGAVEHPGLYELHEGDRAVDAVAAAGGFTDAADLAALNLARFVADAEQLYVPAVGEAPAPGAPRLTARSTSTPQTRPPSTPFPGSARQWPRASSTGAKPTAGSQPSKTS